MNFHGASREGVAINFGFPVWGSCLNCLNKRIKMFPRSLVFFYELNSLIFNKVGH